MYANSIADSNTGTMQDIWDVTYDTSPLLNGVAFTNQTGLTNYNNIPNEWKL
jgi:hypothetical protein